VAGASLGAVLLAGAVFVLGPDPADQPQQAAAEPVTTEADTVDPAPSAVPSTRPPAEQPDRSRKQKADGPTEAEKQREQVDRRSDVFVEVYNNSGISGLAGSTAGRLEGAGWQVVGSDNWYGTIPSSTVYYPDRLRDEAGLLARDLGIGRLKPAISPMRFDRLTLILTSDYS